MMLWAKAKAVGAVAGIGLALGGLAAAPALLNADRAAPATAGGLAEFDQIAREHRTYLDSIASIELRHHVQLRMPPVNPEDGSASAGPLELVVHEGTYASEGGKLYNRATVESPGRRQSHLYQVAWDGSRAYQLDAQLLSVSRNEQSAQPSAPMPAVVAHWLHDQLVSAAASGSLAVGRVQAETLDGVACTKMTFRIHRQTPITGTVWYDNGPGRWPLRSQIESGVDTDIRIERLGRVATPRGEFLYPLVATHRTTEGGRLVRDLMIRIEPESLGINHEITDEMFMISPGPGVQVVDQDELLAKMEAVHGRPSQAAQAPAPAGARAPSGRSGRTGLAALASVPLQTWLIWGGCALLAATVAVAGWRRWQARSV